MRAVTDSGVSVGATALAAVLVCYADPDGSSCYPGDERIRRHLGGVSPRTVSKWRWELRRAGLLACVRRATSSGRGGGRGSAAEWRLQLPRNDRHQGSGEYLNDQHQGSGEYVNDRNVDDRMTGTPATPHLPMTSPLQADVVNQGAGSGPPPELIDFVIGQVRERTGETITEGYARRGIRQKLDGRGPVADPARYLAAVIGNDPQWWLPTPTPPPFPGGTAEHRPPPAAVEEQFAELRARLNSRPPQ